MLLPCSVFLVYFPPVIAVMQLGLDFLMLDLIRVRVFLNSGVACDVDDKSCCDLHTSWLQHASSGHNLQQLHWCFACGMHISALMLYLHPGIRRFWFCCCYQMDFLLFLMKLIAYRPWLGQVSEVDDLTLDFWFQVKYCSENGKRLIHFSTCEVYGKTIGCFLPKDSPLRQVSLHSLVSILY